MRNIRYKGMLAGLLILFTGLLLPVPPGMSESARNAGLVTILMAVWWITEAIPIYATAFLPMVLFPLLGVLPAGDTAINYGHDFVLMMISGFFLAKGIEAQNLHKRIALVLIRALGTSRPVILMSIMLVTAFLSMWIANVTAALLMLPIGMALITKEESSGLTSHFGTALMLGIAYSASIGGTATLIGSPTNMIFSGVLAKMFPEAPSISFLTWLKIGFPLVVVFLPIVWIYLVKLFRVRESIPGSRELIGDELKSMGPMSQGEKRVMWIFILTSLGWIFRENLVIDNFVLPGWSNLLGMEHYVHDSTVGMFSVMLLFMIPDGAGKRLLEWKTAVQIPWGVGVIVGGGYAMASGFKATGLAGWLGLQLAFVSDYPMFVVLLIVVGFILFFTEVNSNTATANIFLPVLASMAVAGNINPLLLMIPATFACSFVFIMPAGTGPNTVIFGSNRVTVPEMARAGLGLKIISMVLLPVLLYFLIELFMGMDKTLPAWAG
ncbi:DASS family sodium-coupled anion symporter [Lentimicrobium sp.]|uniref:SLC13 family permease n=1 Tax=Lentimicrobium sp. TaxID=2034841 RepID=UPI0025ED909B|nr:DASS family sodium-coupled anion symporter [Lentimicrobium sp.]MCO5256592.1 DASS family sodium-coupled anion symporter [Lentimicrobium sp.]HPF63990.1 DASS family sodium-coupled anion symporter [Lentimicrobium sp.]HPJ63481.1 DASS family sodium-coupled anion symporter [Lentimicrobium sp.]HPR26059.1 DASS family sodium-coupled anion symporter [Lentimicrobium sp.]HRW68405.1 DASS family sodium-coupled anion symporter [Lentimicrobium sp.]